MSFKDVIIVYGCAVLAVQNNNAINSRQGRYVLRMFLI